MAWGASGGRRYGGDDHAVSGRGGGLSAHISSVAAAPGRDGGATLGAYLLWGGPAGRGRAGAWSRPASAARTSTGGAPGAATSVGDQLKMLRTRSSIARDVSPPRSRRRTVALCRPV